MTWWAMRLAIWSFAALSGDGPRAEPVPLSAAARPPEPLVVPDWMAKELEHPDRAMRLGTVDRWAHQAPAGSVDLLIQALEDKDERVQALEWMVEDWAREQAAKRGKG